MPIFWTRRGHLRTVLLMALLLSPIFLLLGQSICEVHFHRLEPSMKKSWEDIPSCLGSWKSNSYHLGDAVKVIGVNVAAWVELGAKEYHKITVSIAVSLEPCSREPFSRCKCNNSALAGACFLGKIVTSQRCCALEKYYSSVQVTPSPRV